MRSSILWRPHAAAQALHWTHDIKNAHEIQNTLVCPLGLRPLEQQLHKGGALVIFGARDRNIYGQDQTPETSGKYQTSSVSMVVNQYI